MKNEFSRSTILLNKIRKFYAFSLGEKFLMFFTIGKCSSNFFVKLLPNHYQYPIGSWRKIKRDGIDFLLDISNIVDWYIYFGIKENSRSEFYKRIKDGMVVFDIGANIGDVTLHVAKLCEPSGKVFSFEPHPISFLRLSDHLKMNNISNVSAYQFGLSESNGAYPMYELKNNPGGNRIITDGKSVGSSFNVEVKVLDEIMLEFHLPPPSIMKIDVEGFEMHVLKGSINLLKKFHPIIFIELSESTLQKQGITPKEIVDFLLSFGYELFNASNYVPIGSDSDFKNIHIDILAR